MCKGQCLLTARRETGYKAATDNQRDTMHNSLSNVIWYNNNTVHSKTRQVHKCNNRPSNHILLAHYYVITLDVDALQRHAHDTATMRLS